MDFTFFSPTKLIFGRGKLDTLCKQALPGKKALIVISNGRSTKAFGYLERTQRQLEKANVSYVVYDKIQPNPLRSTVMECAAFAKNNACDFIVALGGGSVMDAAKAIALMATNEGDLWDYVSGGSGKGKIPKEKALAVVAITTTAGTGSEVDQWGVITHETRKEKIGIGFDCMYPVLAIVDAELMLTVPPAFTAYQGFDALFHSTETYINKFANEYSDMVALTAIKNIAENLPKAVANGSDLDARERVALGNTLSGYSMVSGGCTSEHSLEHAMSAHFQELPHGAGLIMVSMAYYKFFIDKKCCDERFVTMAKVMGMPSASKPEDFLTALHSLQAACGVDSLKMSDYGMRKDMLDTIASNAKDTMGGLFAVDRVQLTHKDCVEIYEKSFR